MQSTISLKVSQDLVLKLKKASKIRKVSMSDFIRQSLENILTETPRGNKEPDFFKYLGKFDEDEDLKKFDEDMEKSRSNFKLKQIEF
ncbi:MAG: hypothetical protein WCK98_01165 [bacterium]